jgi:hypothetical protein
MEDCNALIKRYDTKLKELLTPLFNLLVIITVINNTSLAKITEQLTATKWLLEILHEINNIINIYRTPPNDLFSIIQLLRDNCAEKIVGGYSVLHTSIMNPLLQTFIEFEDKIMRVPHRGTGFKKHQDLADLLQAFTTLKEGDTLDRTILGIKQSIKILKLTPIPPDKGSLVTFGGPEIFELLPPSMREGGSGPREGGGAAAGAGGGAAAGAGAAEAPPVLSKTQIAKRQLAAERDALNTNLARKEELRRLVQGPNDAVYRQLHGEGLVRSKIPGINEIFNKAEVEFMQSLPRYSLNAPPPAVNAPPPAVNAPPPAANAPPPAATGWDPRGGPPDIEEGTKPATGWDPRGGPPDIEEGTKPNSKGGRRTRRRRNKKSKSRSRSKKL